MKTRAERRRNNINKAIRKKNICEHNFGFELYDNVHQYSKNKVHCSCPLCQSKTNKDGYTITDKRKIDSMNSNEED